MQLRGDVITELKDNFLSEFQKNVSQLMQQLRTNQMSQMTPTVVINNRK